MGRLTLNVLLSFAQFEREVTGERIRDKIAASKKKGLWMGGFVPVGYAARDRSLVIMEEDAAVVRHIFGRYLDLGSVGLLADELVREGKTTRPSVSQTQHRWGERSFSRGHLYAILKNPLYVGEIVHKGTRHPGQHPPIIDRAIFKAVQVMLAANRGKRVLASNAREPSLLAGLLGDEQGRQLTADHAVKNGKRYRYYVTAPQPGAHAADPARLRRRRRVRYPAGQVEDLVTSTLIGRLGDQHWIATALAPQGADPRAIEALLERARGYAMDLASDTAQVRRGALLALVHRIELSVSGVIIALRRDWTGGDEPPTDLSCGGEIRLDAPGKLIGRGRQDSLVVRGSAMARPVNVSQLKALARAVTWYDELKTNPEANLVTIARREGVTEAYVGQLLRQTFTGAPTAQCGACRAQIIS